MQTPGGQDHQQFDVAKIKNFSGSMSSFLVLFFSFASSLLLGRCRGLVYNVIHSHPAGIDGHDESRRKEPHPVLAIVFSCSSAVSPGSAAVRHNQGSVHHRKKKTGSGCHVINQGRSMATYNVYSTATDRIENQCNITTPTKIKRETVL
jgi:hypothetical protein